MHRSEGNKNLEFQATITTESRIHIQGWRDQGGSHITTESPALEATNRKSSRSLPEAGGRVEGGRETGKLKQINSED
jgi:hypothetical protein